jgi:signal transduction histidine kinase
LKLAQSIKPDLIAAPQLFDKGSKTRTQTRKIPSTHESERLKSVFLDAITHDFRTPLTSIKVFPKTVLKILAYARGEGRTRSASRDASLATFPFARPLVVVQISFGRPRSASALSSGRARY